ncbi:MAG TPA: GWxTD domain-containing protein, partial [Candidatus Cloacimonadota bacterium]|nr:GWxTD domain-containing protein [Candidatus Cloacimonadota bacterium]
YLIGMTVSDPNSGKTFATTIPVEKLHTQSRLSDLELNIAVHSDTLSYLRKFHRQGKLFEPLPSVIFSKTESDYIYLFFEVYPDSTSLGESQLITLSLEQDSVLVMDEYLDFTPSSTSESITLKIPLSDLSLGKYVGTVTLQVGEVAESRSFDFVLTEEQEKRHFVFADLEDEYALMRYFLGSRIPASWSTMNQTAKERYATGFWNNLATQLNRSPDDTIALIQQRVAHANRNYSHHKPGWTTDMGRIYIRNGAPADVETGTSSDDSRFVRKDYQIWKYQGGSRPVYLFIDTQMANNYRLFYVSGDNMETSNPDWMRYLGSDFDTTLLRN